MEPGLRLVLVARDSQDVFEALTQRLSGLAAIPAEPSIGLFALDGESLTRHEILIAGIEKDALRDGLSRCDDLLAAYAIRPVKMPGTRMVVFDTDSTFINEEVIDEIAGFAGYKEQVAAITERAMRGELDFNAALAERVKLLAGLPASTLERVRTEKLTLTQGAKDLTASLHAGGKKTFLLSGGFSYFTKYFRESLGMTNDFANELEIRDGKLTGKTIGPIVNRQRKAELLLSLAAEHGIDAGETVAVGDGANDADMCRASGLGIAFCAKPALLRETDAAIFLRDLRLVMALIPS